MPQQTDQLTCRFCKKTVPETEAKFCPFCGKVLRLSTSVSTQIVIYFVSIFLPPLGFIYTWKYLRQPDQKSKNIGWAATILTAIALIGSLWLGKYTLDLFSQTLNSSILDMGF